MELLKITGCFLACLMLCACSEILYCPNPSQVALVNKLPNCCRYKGVVQPNFCPDGTFSHKLQCLAAKKGGNVVLLTNINGRNNPTFPIYDCVPDKVVLEETNCKTDVSNSCVYCP